MKKLLIAALIATSIMTSAFASDASKVNVRVLHSFNHEFNNAADVNWTVRSTFAKAAFTVNGQKMEAFYDLDGKMIGTSKQISMDELPTHAKRAFAKKYAGYNVKEAIAFEGLDEHAYYISADNEKESVILKVGESMSISIFQKTRKN